MNVCPPIAALFYSWLLVVAILAAPIRAEQDDAAQFVNRVLPLLKQYCTECHGGNDPEAGLSFDTITRADHVNDHPDLWDDLADKIERHEMPPSESAQPTAEERARMVDWITDRLQRHFAAQSPNPGKVTMRRLNRFEYHNTIRDLLGVDYQPEEDFPADNTGYGFDNIGDVLSISPLLLEKYLAAAQKIMDRALVEQAPGEPLIKRNGNELTVVEGRTERYDETTVRLITDGLLTTPLDLSQVGTYEISVWAFGEQAGSSPAQMSVRLNEDELQLIDVPATDAALGHYRTIKQLPAGNYRLGVAFVNDHWDPDEPDPTRRDRNLAVARVEVRPAPAMVWDQLPETHRRIIVRPPNDKNARELAMQSLTKLATRAYRRPVERREVQRLYELFQQATKRGATFEQAMKVACAAVLVSPHFLFRVELGEKQSTEAGIAKLTPHELATRLSYFLWASMPDETLFEAARVRALNNPDQIGAQAKRMLADAKSAALIEGFVRQWLQLRRLKLNAPDTDVFPEFSEALSNDLRQETEMFCAAIFNENRPITDLIDAKFTFINGRLAQHYGLPDVAAGDEQFRRIELSNDTPRGGIITHGSILTLTSHPTRTSPVKRGAWLLELLGAPSPPPPPETPDLAATAKENAGATQRELLEQHRQPTSCGVCHVRIDPLGFGLEHFDAIGRYRTHELGRPIDASGTMPDGTKIDGVKQLQQVLRARQDEFARGFIEKLVIYALGRGITASDRAALDQIAAAAKADDYRFASIVNAIVRSDLFCKTNVD